MAFRHGWDEMSEKLSQMQVERDLANVQLRCISAERDWYRAWAHELRCDVTEIQARHCEEMAGLCRMKHARMSQAYWQHIFSQEDGR